MNISATPSGDLGGVCHSSPGATLISLKYHNLYACVHNLQEWLPADPHPTQIRFRRRFFDETLCLPSDREG